MLNSAPINSWPLNALAGGANVDLVDPDIPITPETPVEPSETTPVEMPSGHAFRWSAIVTLGGTDVSDLLTGSIRIDREEGAAGIAEFLLFYPPGTLVKTDLADRTVTIDYITDDGQSAQQVRVFTGLVAEPSWDASARVMRIAATDNLQQRIEAMSIEQIDQLTKGAWSEDVFRPTEGRSRWDYAQERMATRIASLDCSPIGELRTTSWYSTITPRYIFGHDTTVYQSIDVDLAQLRNVTNRVEIDFSYRYQRLHEATIKYTWLHPGTGGAGSISGFCNWRSMSSELPSTDMVLSATDSAGLTPLNTNWYSLPLTMSDPCGTGAPWINNNADLLLGAKWDGSRRWAQTITENYKLNLSTETGLVEGQQVISRTGASADIDHADAEGWSSSLKPAAADTPGGSTPAYGPAGDRSDDERRSVAINCLLLGARSEIIDAHRKTRVSWEVPTSMALGVDLSHTIEINDQMTRAQAKCSRRIDILDFDTGSALTSITISVMRGTGDSDVLQPPPRIGANDLLEYGGNWGATVSLGTQLGGRFISPTYNESLDGFAGNYDARQDDTLEVFPRRLAISAPEVPEQFTSEKKHEAAHDYLIGIPNDLLEL